MRPGTKRTRTSWEAASTTAVSSLVFAGTSCHCGAGSADPLAVNCHMPWEASTPTMAMPRVASVSLSAASPVSSRYAVERPVFSWSGTSSMMASVCTPGTSTGWSFTDTTCWNVDAAARLKGSSSAGDSVLACWPIVPTVLSQARKVSPATP